MAVKSTQFSHNYIVPKVLESMFVYQLVTMYIGYSSNLKLEAWYCVSAFVINFSNRSPFSTGNSFYPAESEAMTYSLPWKKEPGYCT